MQTKIISGSNTQISTRSQKIDDFLTSRAPALRNRDRESILIVEQVYKVIINNDDVNYYDLDSKIKDLTLLPEAQILCFVTFINEFIKYLEQLPDNYDSCCKPINKLFWLTRSIEKRSRNFSDQNKILLINCLAILYSKFYQLTRGYIKDIT